MIDTDNGVAFEKIRSKLLGILSVLRKRNIRLSQKQQEQ